MKLFNSLTRKKEEFVPINPPKVGMYTCGFTVYDYAHLGSGRKYVNDDILRRTLEYLGFEVNHVQNVTDVGHLVSDADEGEDKLEKGARKFGKTVWEVAEYFTKSFYESMDKLNILRPSIICKATDHIPEQIDMVKTLVEKGFAYEVEDAVYFDVSRFDGYGKMFGQNLEDKITGVRDEVKKDGGKKNPQDFALWVKRKGEHASHAMHWDSPWGDGFPGWHIECSAMSVKYLGSQFDIHTGGEDHLPIHHPNEIAQSEAATGKSPFVKYWVHHRFLKVDGKRMGKSLGNFYTISDVEEKGYDPIALRYLYLTAHYRDTINFTWQSLTAAQNGLRNLKKQIAAAKSQTERSVLSEEKHQKIEDFQNRFKDAVSDDLNMPQALAVLWEVVKSNIPSSDKYDLAMDFDQILGLGLEKTEKVSPTTKVSDEITELLKERDLARESKDFEKADEVRKLLLEKGYEVLDTKDGSVVKKLKDR